MEIKIQNLINQIDEKQKQLNSLRPLPTELVKNLNEWFKIEQTYCSNAIEGNTITKSETALIVEKGITVSGKSLKEHLEIKNYAFAIDYIKTLSKKTKNNITLKIIKELHFLILKGIDDANAGTWRKVEVKSLGSDTKLPDPIKIPDLMQEFINWLHQTNIHPALVAIDVHYKLVKIHPFIDGNGRIARLLMNLLLLQADFPTIIIDPKDKPEYISGMQEVDKSNDFTKYHLFMLKNLEKSIDIYLNAALKTIK
ncbi:Fic family protein [Candidatus Dependentiae bacterium]|nr:Fic family protein [Candidatus Dependentiae bacterium]